MVEPVKWIILINADAPLMPCQEIIHIRVMDPKLTLSIEVLNLITLVVTV